MSSDQFERLITAAQQGSLADFDAALGSDPSLVLRRDEDNVTLLHWAAINNHAALVHHILALAGSVQSERFCDSIGGSLAATPIHWAARNGAMDAVIALAELAGADLQLADGQGMTPLHTAAAFEHKLIVMYLVAKGVDLEQRDEKTGRTALSWACCMPQGNGEAAAVLLKCGAQVNVVDNDGRTPLHWALVTGKWDLCVALLRTPGIDTSVADRFGKLPFEYCPPEASGSWLMALLKHEKDPNHSDASEEVQERVRYWLPFVAIPVSLYLMSHFEYLVSVPITSAFMYVVYRIGIYFWQNPRLEHKNAFYLGFYLCSVWVLVLTAFFTPYVTFTLEKMGIHYFLALLGLSIGILISYHKLVTMGPGFLPRATLEDDKKLVLQLAREHRLTDKYYCYSCGILRPLRSKHDPSCDRCVPRFDHHCQFTQSCVGQGNHLTFMNYLVTTILGQILFAYVGFAYLKDTCGFDTLDSFWLADFLSKITGFEMTYLKVSYTALNCSPWITAVVYWDLLHLSWELFLFGFQFFVNIIRSQTTNEFVNQKKYDYFWRQENGKQVYRNPFNRGLLQNFLSFWTSYGVFSKVDYGKLFSIPDDKKAQ